MPDDQLAAFDAQVERVQNSGWLSRSHPLTRLFEFLASCRRTGQPVREADIAYQVFGRQNDMTGDAFVRVQVHRLRRKLASFYAGPGLGELHRLSIPLGDYRLVLDSADPVVSAPVTPRRRGWILAVGAAAVLGFNIVLWAWFTHGAGADQQLHRALAGPPWSLIDGDRPVTIVIGDYYIFGEINANGVTRMIREFDVNSPEDLQEKLMENSDLKSRYIDLDTNYTAFGSTEALQYILPVLRAAVRDPKRLQMIASSELTPEMLKNNDIVYVGYLSALRLLEEPVFARSRLKVGLSYDYLVDRKTGRVFDSDAGLAARQEGNVDYGYLRAFDGPTGNHIVVVAGTRDIGVAQMAESAVDGSFRSGPTGPGHSIEALYEVRGIGRTNISARKVDLDQASLSN